MNGPIEVLKSSEPAIVRNFLYRDRRTGQQFFGHFHPDLLHVLHDGHARRPTEQARKVIMRYADPTGHFRNGNGVGSMPVNRIENRFDSGITDSHSDSVLLSPVDIIQCEEKIPEFRGQCRTVPNGIENQCVHTGPQEEEFFSAMKKEPRFFRVRMCRIKMREPKHESFGPDKMPGTTRGKDNDVPRLQVHTEVFRMKLGMAVCQ